MRQMLKEDRRATPPEDKAALTEVRKGKSGASTTEKDEFHFDKE